MRVRWLRRHDGLVRAARQRGRYGSQGQGIHRPRPASPPPLEAAGAAHLHAAARQALVIAHRVLWCGAVWGSIGVQGGAFSVLHVFVQPAECRAPARRLRAALVRGQTTLPPSSRSATHLVAQLPLNDVRKDLRWRGEGWGAAVGTARQAMQAGAAARAPSPNARRHALQSHLGVAVRVRPKARLGLREGWGARAQSLVSQDGSWGRRQGGLPRLARTHAGMRGCPPTHPPCPLHAPPHLHQVVVQHPQRPEVHVGRVPVVSKAARQGSRKEEKGWRWSTHHAWPASPVRGVPPARRLAPTTPSGTRVAHT